MEQYKKKVARVLRPVADVPTINVVNETAELTMSGKRLVVPTAEAFYRLSKKVSALEQRLNIVDNKAIRALRQE